MAIVGHLFARLSMPLIAPIRAKITSLWLRPSKSCYQRKLFLNDCPNGTTQYRIGRRRPWTTSGGVQTENLSEALRHLVDSFGAETGTLHLLEEDGLLHLKALAGEFPPSVLAVMHKIPVGKGMAGLAVERGYRLTPATSRPTPAATSVPAPRRPAWRARSSCRSSTASASSVRWALPTAASAHSAKKKRMR